LVQKLRVIAPARLPMASSGSTSHGPAAERPPASAGVATAERPRRMALAFLGSRGDCQPYVALALGLAARGHVVKAFSNEMHRSFVEAYGIDFVAFAPQRVQLDGKQEHLREFGAELFSNTYYVQDLAVFAKEIERFDPEIILSGTVTDKYSQPMGEKLSVPVMDVRLQSSYPNRRRLLMGIPSFPRSLGWANLAVWRLFFNLGAKFTFREMNQASQRVLGIQPWKGISGQAMYDAHRQARCPNTLIANPRVLLEALYGRLPRNLRLTGYLVVGAERQLSEAGAGQFGGEAARRELEAFLSAGDPPVYLGWGSMIPEGSDHTVLRAVGAAKTAGRRAVIVGGWAQLSREKLQAAAAARGRPDLAEYAERNVAFAAQAPHEWLFPRCACVVHHGGSGTTAASLRSGVPTIVTPVVLDQFDYAIMVQELGVGLGLKRLTKLSEKELGAAIVRACTSTAMRQRAAEIGGVLREEDGVAAAVAEIEKALALHELGEFRTLVQCARERQHELDATPRELTPSRLALSVAGSFLALRRLRRFAAPPRSAL